MEQYDKTDVMKHLYGMLKDELEGIISYNTVYEALKSVGMDAYANDIEYICREEYKHAEILHDMIEDECEHMLDNQEIARLWSSVKHIFHVAD